MFAKIEVECKHSEQVIHAIEVDSDINKKFSAKMSPKENGIVLEVESKDISGLMAGINSNLKLVKLAGEISEFE